MNDPYVNLSHTGKAEITPLAAHLYIPPITWRGDPLGHIGSYDCFFFVVTGECYVKIDDVSFVLGEGQLAYLPKGKMRTYTTMSPNITMYEIAFDYRIQGTDWYEALACPSDCYTVDVSDKAALSALFEGCVRHEMQKDILYDVVCFSNIAAIAKIWLEGRYEAELRTRPFKQVLAFMDENIHRQIKVEELSKVSLMQTTYFIKKFKAAFGISPISYLNKLKIYRSMTLLLSTELSVERIAQSIGIIDNSYYSRMFKRLCSVSPVEYRKLFKKE